MKLLSVNSTRELENLVISAIYAGLVTGTLDPHHQRVAISSISPLRDVAPTSIPQLVSTLKEWSSRCSSTLNTLESQIAKIRADAARRHKEEMEWSASVESMIEKEGAIGKENVPGGKVLGGNKQGRKGGEKRGFFGVGGAKDDADMDVDEDEDEEDDRRDGGAKSQKKRTLGGVSLNFGR
jgi:COP9 signalosome complex subunit 7